MEEGKKKKKIPRKKRREFLTFTFFSSAQINKGNIGNFFVI